MPGTDCDGIAVARGNPVFLSIPLNIQGTRRAGTCIFDLLQFPILQSMDIVRVNTK